MNAAVVYRMYADDGDLLYIGCAQSLPRRLGDYERDHRRNAWFDAVVRIEVERFSSHAEARRAEAAAIAAEAPRHNFDFNARRRADRPRPQRPVARVAFGSRLRDARHTAGLTRDEFAAACGVTKGCVSHWENGRSVPTLTKQAVIAAVLNVAEPDLFSPVVLVRAS